MRNCKICGHANPGQEQFCVECAARLEPNCPVCGQPVPAGNKFCGQCGTPMTQSQRLRRDQVRQSLQALMPTSLAAKIKAVAAEIVGERREVTVLFVDIANFTATAHALDSEEVYLLTDEAMRLLAEVIYKYEGTIDKYTGDGLMALFGAPVAHENDPERAVRAALEIQSALQPLRERIQQRHELDFQARIGINTGLVIAGQVGGDLHMEYTVIGDTVNMADRLQKAAEPGTVLVSFSTYQRTRPFFRYQTLPPLTVKGKPRPVRGFRPLGLRTKPGQVRGLPGLQVPMIGRQDALAQLENALDRVQRGRCCEVALVTGEAGVGKSRLVMEFYQSTAQLDINFFQGSCQNYARLKPLWLVATLLRNIVNLSETDLDELQCETLRVYLEQLGLASDDVLPYLIQVLGLRQPDPRMEARLRKLDNTVMLKLTHAAMRQVLLAEAQLAPAVLVFEDLHWIDPASRDLVEYLIRTVEDVPLMLVLVSRDAERESVIRPLVAAAEKNADRMVDIKLGPLSKMEGELLVDHLLQTTDESRELKRHIADRAEGNPFYAEEIVRMLIEENGLERKNGNWHITPRAIKLVQQVPGTLNGLILARFDRLSVNLRRTLQKAAVLGPSFPLTLLQSLNGLTPESLAAQISTLEARQFLTALSFGADESYAFRHALMQEVIYGTLLKRDRKTLHERVAQLIEQGALWTPDERTEALAYHYAEGPNPSKAIPYLISAAENAARRCSHETALQHYQRALALLKGKCSTMDEQFVRAQIGLGRARKFLGSYAQAFQIIKGALQGLLHLSLRVESISLLPVLVHGLRELADIQVREGSLDAAVVHLQAALEALGDEGSRAYAPLWRSLMDRLAWVYFRQGKLEEAFRLASSATLRLTSEQEDDPLTMASLYNTLGGVLWQQGNLSEAIIYVGNSLGLYKELNYLWGMATAYTNLGVLHYALGDWPEAAHNLEQAVVLQGEIGDLQNRALALNNLGTLRQAMGEHEAAQQDLEISLSIRQRLGDTWGTANSYVSLASLAVDLGRFKEAAAHVESALRLSSDLGAIGIEGRWVLALSQAEEDLEKGIKTAEQALQMAREAELAQQEADCRRVLGVLRARVGEFLEAEVLLRESVDLCVQLDAPHNRALALLELGRLYQRLVETDDRDRAEWQGKARVAFGEAIEQFESLGASYHLQTARAALNRLGDEAGPKVPQTPVRVVQPEVVSSPLDQGLPEGEWHTVAVVWFTLSPPSDADEEEVFEAIALATPALVTIAREYDGQVIRRQDGLTLVFGAPTAFEDDAERAVQTAWQMMQYLRDPVHQTEVPLDFRAAVSMGDIVAGEIGSHLHTEFVAKGEPVEIAQRLSEFAPSGTVWVTGAVRAATERVFIYEAPSSAVTDRLADLPLWALVGRREKPAPARGLPGLEARLIGRESHLQAMGTLFQNLDQGIGGLIWIEGEPGIGKSRLMREFAASIADADASVWTGRCSPQRSGNAFSLFSDLLAHALNVQPTDTPDQIRVKIDRALQIWPRDAQMTRPYLEMLLGLWPVGLHGERLAGLEPEQLRQQTFVAMRRLCKGLTTQRPLVLLLDDLHWIDPVSAELLGFLLTIVASAPVFFICAQRRQGADLPNERLVRIQSLIPTQTVSFCLERLSSVESETLLAELLSDTALPTPLTKTILRRSEGNPYFIEEFLRMLIEQGHLQARHGRWEVNPDLVIEDITLPSTLETLIRSRVDALPSELKKIMQYAAVIGTPFEAGLLEAVSSEVNAKANLRRLESRLLVLRSTEASQWTFNHSLIESVVYNSLLKAQRKMLHLRVAEVLETRWAGSEEDHAEELAYHFSRADESAKALTYLMMAGERAASRYANEEAITYFERAGQLLRMEPQASDHLRWRLAAGLGEVYRNMGRYADSTAALLAGLTLVEASGLSAELGAGLFRRLGDTAQKQGELDSAYEYFSEALKLLAEPTDDRVHVETARVLIGMAWNHFLQGRLDQAREKCETSLAHARRVRALNELAAAENLLGGVCYRQNQWALAMQHTRRAMVLREQMGYTWGVAATLSNLGILAVQAGDWNKARSFFERSLALRQEVGDVEGVAIVHNNMGSLARDQGELDQAEFHFRESLAIAKPFEIGFHVANSTIGLAQVLLMKGEIEAAQTAIADSLTQAQAIGAPDMHAEICRVHAEVLLARSKWDEARTKAEEATELATETGNRALASAVWRIVSEIELQRGRTTAAREALARAQELLADVTDELEAGRVSAQSGRIHLLQGDRAEAEEDLRSAKMIFMRLGANLDLERVEAALAAPAASTYDTFVSTFEPEPAKV